MWAELSNAEGRALFGVVRLLRVPVLAQHRNAGSAYLLADGRGYIAESGTVESLARPWTG